MRLVIDLIRGKSVDDALHILHFSPKHASKVAEKVLRSAVSNLQNQDGGGRLETEQMVVKSASVDGAMIMKRISPAPMGRAFRIRKRSNHLTIVVAAKEEAKPVKKAEAKPEKKEEPKGARKEESKAAAKGELRAAKKEEPKAAKKEEPKPAKKERAGKKTK
jgi:large subunit ribosomal protein L22